MDAGARADKEETAMPTSGPARWLQRGLVAGACLLLAACAPTHKALTPEAQGRIHDVHVQVVLPQESFTFTASSPGVATALGGGLIPALIDAGVQKSRQQTLHAQAQPLMDQLLDVDFRTEARAVLAQAVADFPLKIARTEVLALMPTAKEQEQIVAGEPARGAYLCVVMQYDLDLEARRLVTRSSVKLWQQGQKDPAFVGAAIYEGTPLPREDAAVPAAVRLQMQQAVAHTLRLTALDIEHPAAKGSGPKRSFAVPVAGRAPVNLQGEVLAKDGGRTLMRTNDGVLFSVER
jgi:hypothetical protein